MALGGGVGEKVLLAVQLMPENNNIKKQTKDTGRSSANITL